MAGRARLALIAAVLAPLPLLAAVSWGVEAGSARGRDEHLVHRANPTQQLEEIDYTIS